MTTEPTVRDPNWAVTSYGHPLREITAQIWSDLITADRDTAYFCKHYGSSWRTRLSDLRLYLQKHYGLTVSTKRIPGSHCVTYSIEEWKR